MGSRSPKHRVPLRDADKPVISDRRSPGTESGEDAVVRATVLDQRAAQVPGPLGERLRSNAGRLRDLADAHYRTRTTLQDGTA